MPWREFATPNLRELPNQTDELIRSRSPMPRRTLAGTNRRLVMPAVANESSVGGALARGRASQPPLQRANSSAHALKVEMCTMPNRDSWPSGRRRA